MDVIQLFNDELNSLLDTKPPVSKAKMGLITRAAMKGVKLYKHIVQSVEKFILKCRPEYKVPGLYVVDSIVRQSRHQFGPDRDVYASRFSRNLQSTFANLFAACLPEDKPKIVRVLNLWQKNGVFNSHVIQPLMDMANPNTSALALPTESTLSADSPSMHSSNANESSQQAPTKSKYLSYNNNQNNNTSNNNNKANTSFAQNPTHSTARGTRQNNSAEDGLRFSKNMLDFDYDEDDDDDGDETPTEAEPPLSSTLNKIEMEHRGRNDSINLGHQASQQIIHPRQAQLAGANLVTMRSEPDPVLERWHRLIKQQSITNDSPNKSHSVNTTLNDSNKFLPRPRSRSPPPTSDVQLKKETARNTSIVQPTNKSPELSSKERDAERKAERARKCFPDIKDKHLTVCSTTLWLGHVPKTVSEADISDAFGEFGTITSIDLIPPRGCAYVCMDRRQDAKKALMESKDLKLNQSHIKMAWAPGKGFKEYKKLKDFWEVDKGCSYIPYSRIDHTIDFEVLEEGGVIDEDSMSMEMRERRDKKFQPSYEEPAKDVQHPAINVPIPSLPMLSQPPPQFTVPPPNLAIPPPAALGQASGIAGIPFPPPTLAVGAPMPLLPPPSQAIFDTNSNNEQHDSTNSPNSIDHQLKMTERQINMVEQQLSMIHHAHNIGHAPPQMPNVHPAPMFLPGQANPMLYDLQQGAMLHVPPIMDPTQQQIPMFANPAALLGHPPLMPISQAGMNPNMNGNSMSHHGPRY